MPTGYLKRIINDLGIKKPYSGEITTYFFLKNVILFWILTVCVNEVLKTDLSLIV